MNLLALGCRGALRRRSTLMAIVVAIAMGIATPASAASSTAGAWGSNEKDSWVRVPS